MTDSTRSNETRATIPDALAERLQTCTTFPSPPPVALKVIELAQDPKTDLRLVADTCSGDPAIAAKIMKIANSAFYASRRQSTNLRQALIVLGLNATLTLALSFTLVSGLRRNSPKGFDFMAYWRRAILAATWGKLIATEFRQPIGEEVFISSLLQDIGMLVIDRVAPDTYANISPFEIDHDKLAKHETNVLGADHTAVGSWLMNSWNMPETLVRSVLNSHDITAAEVEDDRQTYTRIIAVSGRLADIWLKGADEVSVQRIGMELQKYLEISPQRLGELFETVREQLPVAEEIFEMSLFDQEYLRDITDSAREVLMIRNLHMLSEAVDLQRQATRLQTENIALKQETMLDGLTGVRNRRYFEDSFSKEFESSRNHGWPLSLIFIDLDYFKEINDTHGHPTGDEMLRRTAQLIEGSLRSEDVVARYGGDEFVVLLPGSDDAAAAIVADRIVKESANSSLSINGSDVLTTLSLGVVTMEGGADFETTRDMLEAADKALYHSKKNGRNRHTCYETIRAA